MNLDKLTAHQGFQIGVTGDLRGHRSAVVGVGDVNGDSAVANVTIANPDSLDQASFVAPNEPGKQVHIILEVTDNGTPPLVGYQRIICDIK
ncbi:MAG: hypothetical protein ABI680_14270 [Chthoniobacteraceae bacterium]